MAEPEENQTGAADQVKSPELRLLMEAEDTLPTLGVAGRADAYLLSVIDAAAVPPAADPPTTDESRHLAIWIMAIQTHRATRSAMLLHAIGYPDQAVVFKRIIGELHAGVEKVWDDKSGEYARTWLDDRTGVGGAKAMGQELYKMLSGTAHATVRGTLDWTAISLEDGSVQVEVGPSHRPEVANPSLTIVASEVRDIGCMLARLSGKGGDPPGDLDAELQNGFATYLPDPEL
jgi:hypothetical protein